MIAPHGWFDETRAVVVSATEERETREAWMGGLERRAPNARRSLVALFCELGMLCVERMPSDRRPDHLAQVLFIHG